MISNVVTVVQNVAAPEKLAELPQLAIDLVCTELKTALNQPNAIFNGRISQLHLEDSRTRSSSNFDNLNGPGSRNEERNQAQTLEWSRDETLLKGEVKLSVGTAEVVYSNTVFWKHREMPWVQEETLVSVKSDGRNFNIGKQALGTELVALIKSKLITLLEKSALRPLRLN